MIVKSLFFPQFRDVSAVPVIAVCWVVALVPTIPLWFGVMMVVLAATAVPRIGVATYVSAIITGQLTAAILYDHYGILGQTVREATPLRLLGVGFLILGIILIRRF